MIVLLLLLKSVLCSLIFDVERKLKTKGGNYSTYEFVFQIRNKSQNHFSFEKMHSK